MFNKTLRGHRMGLITSPKRKQLISLSTLSVCPITHPIPLCHDTTFTCMTPCTSQYMPSTCRSKLNYLGHFNHPKQTCPPPRRHKNFITQQPNHKTSGNKPDPNLPPTTTELRLLQPCRPLSPNSQSHPLVLSEPKYCRTVNWATASLNNC